MRFVLILCLLTIASASEKKIKLKDLPPAVRQTVDDLSKTSILVGLAKENENGETTYEAETKINGKTRDVTIDSYGKIVMIEEEVSLASIPDGARTAIERAAAGARIALVEKVSKGNSVKYEAAIASRTGKKKEVSFTADGSPVK